MRNQNLDQQLKELALEARRHPPQSKQRQIALTRLVMAIKRSGQLCRPCPGQFRGFYQDIYDEACNQVFLYLCQNIDRYDANKAVLRWVNFLLSKRFNNAAKFILKNRSDVRLLGERGGRDRLDFLPAAKLHPSLSDEIIFWIQSDPEGVFKRTHVAGCPQANFRYLALQRIEGNSWKTLSERLNISLKTLSCFHDRCLTKFAPKLKGYLHSY